MDYQIKFIDYGSNEYYQAAQLRYRLFYQEHNIPFESIFEPAEKQDLHLAITTSLENIVLAYGRLGKNNSDEFQIYQMVVMPEHQGHGLGMRILHVLIEVAVERGASLLTLNARTTKVRFYQKAGFETIGEVFASYTTGVPHIKMQKNL